MNSLPVTVVITNYNQGKFIERALKSLIQQSYGSNNLDILIIDDGSTDNSKLTITNNILIHKDSFRSIELISKTNGGTASARNCGIKNNKNSIIFFLDIDDEYLENKIFESVQVFNKYETIGLVYTDYYEVHIDKTKSYNIKGAFDGNELFNSCIVSTNSAYKAEIFKEIGVFDESIKVIEDYDFYLRLNNSKYMLYNIPKPLFVYYNHGQNKTHISSRQLINKEMQKVQTKALNARYQTNK